MSSQMAPVLKKMSYFSYPVPLSKTKEILSLSSISHDGQNTKKTSQLLCQQIPGLIQKKSRRTGLM